MLIIKQRVIWTHYVLKVNYDDFSIVHSSIQALTMLHFRYFFVSFFPLDYKLINSKMYLMFVFLTHSPLYLALWPLNKY